MASSLPSLNLLRHELPAMSRIKRRLDALWVSHVRALLQVLHDTVDDKQFAEMELNMQARLRYIVRETLSNMIMLGATNTSADSDLSQYYIPSFATMAFAMTEYFVSYCGFTGDEDPIFREDIFDALSLLQCSMVASPTYTFSSPDAPGFSTLYANPMIYGVGKHTKMQQVEEITKYGSLLHQFGSGLARYELGLGGSAYQLLPCKPEDIFVATRPSTPN
ncbi:hypothetical protein B0H11DRAFT_2188602 [Mycena galericulata]|nr:hypothetical protein B0H11DRAFT_2188602 [Mycena galericulata]